MNWIFKFAAATLIAVLLVACGGGSSSAPPTVDVTGNWKGTARGQAGGTGVITFSFKQTGADVGGSMGIPNNSCIKNAAVSGSVSGNEFSGQVAAGDIKASFKGVVIGNAMSGTYDVNSGPCGTELGTFNVTR